MRQCPTQCPGGNCHDHPIWSEGEKAGLRAFSLFLIRSIVQRHGGSIEIDLATDTITIDVPDEEMVACAQEIEAQVNTMCH